MTCLQLPPDFHFWNGFLSKSSINLAVLVHGLHDGNVKKSWTEMKHSQNPSFEGSLNANLSSLDALTSKCLITPPLELFHITNTQFQPTTKLLWGKWAQNSGRKNKMRHFILGPLNANWNSVCFELTERLVCQSPAKL